MGPSGPFFFIYIPMSNTTIDLDTELSAVNSILGSIGQAPVTTLGKLTTTVSSTDEVANTYENPEIALIYNIFKSCCQDVQNEGWHFNKEYHVEVEPDGNKNIVIPNNYLRYDLNQNQVFKDKDLVRRNGKLYDLVNHTDEFEDKLYLDIVYFISFEDLPPVFRRYIISKASVKAATQLVNNSELVQLLQTEEATNRAACVEYDTDQGDYSFMGWPENTSYRAFQPYKVLQR